LPLTEVTYDQLQRADSARLTPLVSSDEKEPGNKREVPTGDEDAARYLSVRTLRNQFLDYLTSKVDEIEEQKDARRYYHGAHLTADQLRILRARHQPPIVWNRTNRKINGIVGLVEKMRSDPKALPRTPKSEQGAEIATQSIRYVLDCNEWKTIDPWCILQSGIDGIAGTQRVLTHDKKGNYNLRLDWVIGDEYFYQPKSYRMDFADSRYEGLAKWLDLDEAIELFPEQEELLNGLFEGDSDLTTNPDRDIKWLMTSTRHLRLVEHWYKHRGRWCWAFYVGAVLIDQGESPFFDDEGNSISSFDMFSAAVDQDGDRYGFVRNLKGPQDSLNQGKSKMLHLANTKLLKGTKGVVDDVETARREASRPDGYLEVNPGGTLELVQTTADLAAFSQFTEDAKAELDAYANSNIAAMTGAGMANISGRALEILRQPGMAELGPFILAVRGWKLRLYRNIWNTVQRYWTAERWIRVNNNEGLGQFIQLNGLGLDQSGLPSIINAVGALDVDIILEEGRDIASMMADTSDALKGYPPGTFPPQVLIEMSDLPRSEKNRIMQMMSPKPPPPDPMGDLAKRLSLESLAGKNAKTAAETVKTHAGAEELRAKAEKERAEVGTAAARAGHLASAAHIDAAEFARDTLLEAHRIANPEPPAGAPNGSPQRSSMPQQYPLPF